MHVLHTSPCARHAVLTVPVGSAGLTRHQSLHNGRRFHDQRSSVKQNAIHHGNDKEFWVETLKMQSFMAELQSKLRKPEGEEKIKHLMSQMENQDFAARIGAMMRNAQEMQVYTMTREQVREEAREEILREEEEFYARRKEDIPESPLDAKREILPIDEDTVVHPKGENPFKEPGSFK